ncbi:hypothetical protein FDK38_004822 [Candidozyma auris]|nr:hypothetical protein FDK38_004822 [[Candida] auris]
MRHHISTSGGLQRALNEAFEIIESRPTSEQVYYFNCTSHDSLRHAVQKQNFSWTSNSEKLKNFHYEHVEDLHDLSEKVKGIVPSSCLMIVEHLDHIVLQPTATEYYRQNELLTTMLQKMENVIFLDDWGYLDKYHVVTT